MISEMLQYLQNLPSGPIPAEKRGMVLKLIADSWEEFTGSADTKMGSWKVVRDKGPVDLTWSPPVLSFTIERHGSLVRGSSRAEKQCWQLDLEKRTAHEAKVGFRQIHRPASPFSTEQMAVIANQVCRTVQEGPNSSSEYKINGIVIWKGSDEVDVKHGVLIPAAAYQQTTSGRRKRFRAVLEQKMKAIGWKLDKVGRTLMFNKSGVERD
jgi:hypothetical protein